MIQLNEVLQTCLYFQALHVRSKAAVMISILYHLLRLSASELFLAADPFAETNKRGGVGFFQGTHFFNLHLSSSG